MTLKRLKILYLVHDVFDPAVGKRVSMLRSGGADVRVMGFRRSTEVVSDVMGADVVDLGQTYNGGFVQRILSVVREVVLVRRHRVLFADADVVIARNLEMLAIAVRGRSPCMPVPTLVYESLDVHRLLLRRGPIGKALRALEGWLSRRAMLLITSSPGFVRHYYDLVSDVDLPLRLVENRVYLSDDVQVDAGVAVLREGPPWRIGWFGAIRCYKSLKVLSDLVAGSNGKIEVVIRGRVARDRLPDFDDVIARNPGMSFEGAYKNPDDLAMIYNDVHFTWAIDMYQEGMNSAWLLPNRIYEGGLYGAVPLAVADVETGLFLKRLGIGVLLQKPLKEALVDFFDGLDPVQYAAHKAAALAVDRSVWRCGEKECSALVADLTKLKEKA